MFKKYILSSTGVSEYKQNELIQNKSRLQEISGKITSELIPILSAELSSFRTDNRVIVTTGSDGRMENIPDSSNLELIIYGDKLNNNLEKIILSVFSMELNNIPGVEIHPSTIENFDLLKSKLIEYSKNKQLFPTRFLDSKYLGGNFEIYKNLRFRFVKEVKESKSKDLKKFYSKLLYHKKILNNGKVKFKGNNINYLDKEDKTIGLYYKSGSDSLFKMGPLRVYQYTLAKLILMFIRKKQLTDNDIIELMKMPKTISSKLDYIRDEIKNFGQYESLYREIIDTYYYFLKLHNESRKEFNKKDIKIPLTSEEFSIINDRLDFIKKNVNNWELK